MDAPAPERKRSPRRSNNGGARAWMTVSLGLIAFMCVLVCSGSAIWISSNVKGGLSSLNPFGPPTIIESIAPPTVTSLERLSDLVTVSPKVIVLVTEKVEGTGPVGEQSVTFFALGDALISVDIGKAQFLDIDKEKQAITIRLPKPRVKNERVIEKESQWKVEESRFRTQATLDDMKSKARLRAPELIREAASSEEHLSFARERTEMILKIFCEQLGWKHVRVEWDK